MQRNAFIEQFELMAAERGAAPAIVAGERVIGYHGLNEAANRIAHGLIAVGQGGAAGAPVGLFLESGIDYVAGLLGIAKTAGVFLPVPVDLPERRLQAFLETARTTLVLTDAAHHSLLRRHLEQLGLAGRVTVMTLEALSARGLEALSAQGLEALSARGGGATHNPGVAITPTAGAYVMFTSGSTGVPKAILGQQRGLSHFLRWELETFGIDAASRVSWLAPINFDVSLRDILVPLMAGGVLCVPDADTRLTPHRLVDWLADQRVTLVHCVPTVLRLMIRALEDRAGATPCDLAGPFPALRHILVAGEPLYGSDVLAWRAVAGCAIGMVNLYGPTETTLAKLFHPIGAVPEDARRMIPIGRPLPRTDVLVVSEGRACAVGEIGELHIRTAYRSLGYLNDPAATAQAFISNPLSSGGGAEPAADIVYRTGDLGRLSADGTIECLGRKDGQFKINGVRVEIGEIEAVLRQLPGLGDVAVATELGPDRQPVIVAYVTRRDGGTAPLGEDEFAEVLDRSLPRSMQPRHFVVLASLPKTVTGKLNRRGLPRLEMLLQDQAGQGDDPQGNLEGQIAAIWCEVLGVPRVGATRRFQAYGGDSLKAIKVVAGLYRTFGVDVPLRVFFTEPTVRGLASHLAAPPATEGGESGQSLSTPVLAPVPRVAEAPDYPATPAQIRLWSLYRMGVAPSAYNLAEAFVITGDLDGAALAGALALLVERHESLRTTFVEREGVVRQVIHPRLPPVSEWGGLEREGVLERGDLRGARDPQASAATVFAANRDYPFDLERGPLFRTALYRLPDAADDGASRHLLLFNVHHIVSDVRSLAILVEELGAAYEALRGGASPALAPVSVRYRDFAVWQAQRLQEGALDGQRDYWRAVFATLPPPLDLPVDRPRPPVQTFAGDTRRFVLGATLVRALDRVAREAGTTRFALLVSLVLVHLHRLTGKSDIVVGAPVLGRDRPEFERVVGYCVNTVALRGAVAPGEPFATLLGRVAGAVERAMENQSFPFDALVSALPLERDMSRSPLFDVMVVEQAVEGLEFDLAGVRTTVFGREEEAWKSSRFDLVFHFQAVEEGLALDLNFNTDLFDASRIARYGRQFETLAEHMAQAPQCRVGELALLAAPEQQAIRAFTQGATVARPVGATLPGLVAEIAARYPERPALVEGARTLSYRQMNRAADRLAARLGAAAGVEPGDRVAVFANRSVETVVALLAILKAGAVYVPIDTEYPEQRVATLIARAGCRLVLVDRADAAARLPAGGPPTLAVAPVLDAELGSDSGLGGGATEEVPAVNRARAGDVAYLIFTSGSTGQPKAVMAEHTGFINMALSMIEAFELGVTDRTLQFASPSFDASLFNIFLALLAGGAVALPDRAVIESVPRFLAFLGETGVTCATLPPTYLRTLNRAPLAGVRVLITAGEAAPVAELVHYAQTLNAWNAYGPTETSVCASIQRVSAADAARVRIPIGRPIPNTTLHILDGALQPVPLGVPGEIFLGGVGLARGYQEDPGQTAARFLVHPTTGERLYRTGDVAIWREEGAVDFLGRTDDQVKISGHRIELAEVEHALRAVAGVCDAYVTTLARADGSLALVGYYVVTAEGVTAGEAEAGEPLVTPVTVRRQLNRGLPGYAVPAHLLEVAALPMTVNGKVDRAALPSPLDRPAHAARDAGTPVEHVLLALWRGILERQEIGVDDDFFALGGDSIRAIQIVSALRARGLVAEVRDIFTNPTVRDLAAVIGAAEGAAAPRAEARPAAGEAPLTPLQHWFFTSVTGARHHFNQAVELRCVGGLSGEAAAVAVTALWRHHDQLRARFFEANGVLGQRLLEDFGAPTLIRLDEDEEGEGGVADWESRYLAAAARLHGGFDLARGPLFGAVIVSGVAGSGVAGSGVEGRVLLVAHHLVVDAVSWLILIDDFTRAYDAARHGQPITLPPRTTAYFEIARALGAEKVAPAPAPVSAPAPAAEEPGAPVTVEERLDAEAVRMLLETVAPERGVPLEALVLGALACAWDRPTPLVVEVERHGRDRLPAGIDATRTVGWFTALLPLTLAGDAGVYAASDAAARQLRAAPPATGAPVAAVFNHLGTLATGAEGPFTVNWNAPGPALSPGLSLGKGVEVLTALEDGTLTISVTAVSRARAATLASEIRSHLEAIAAEGGIEATGRHALSAETLDLLLTAD